MEFFRIKKDIPFMRHALMFNIISLVTFLLAVFFLFTKGLHLSVEFTGGTLIEVALRSRRPTSKRFAARSASPASTTSRCRTSARRRTCMIRLPLKSDQNTAQARRSGHDSRWKPKRPAPQLRRVEFVGPQVGKELAENGAMALLLVVIGIVIYLAFRFEWRFSVSAIIANLHDVIIILGFFAFFQWEFSLLGAGGRARRARLLGQRVGRRLRPGARNLQEGARPDHAGSPRPRHHQHHRRAPSSRTAARR